MLTKRLLSNLVFNQLVRKRIPRVQHDLSAFYSNSLFVKAIEDAENVVDYCYETSFNPKGEHIESAIFDQQHLFSNKVM